MHLATDVKLTKYTALGNTYLIASPEEYRSVSGGEIRLLCSHSYGIGADGLLQLCRPPGKDTYSLRIWNPDGSEAERSGNGIRIAAAYLATEKWVLASEFALLTAAGPVQCSVSQDGRDVTVRIGRAIFESDLVPIACGAAEALEVPVDVDGELIHISAVSLGNPHCVVFVDAPSEELARTLGPKLECHPIFPNRTNVQFVHVLDRRSIRIEIWERGAGYTLSSGTSSCAAAVVSHRCGLVDDTVAVTMPGGTLFVRIGEHYFVTLSGPVTRIGEMSVDRGLLEPWRQTHGK